MLKHLHAAPAKPKRVAVLGAGGFIAGAIARALSSEKIPVLPLGRPGFDLLKENSFRDLADLLRPDDTLVFASAKAPVKNVAMLRENIVMAEAVCAALRAKPVAHVVYISSDAVYQDSPQPLSESSCAEPASLHGAMHLTREVARKSEYAGPLAIVRSTLVYGLDDPHNGYGPNRFRRLAAEGKEIVLFGEGEERRDHVDVEDVAALVSLIVAHRSSGIVNAVSGQVVSFRELAEFAASEFAPRVAVKGSPRNGPMPHDGYRPFQPSAALKAFPGFRFKSWRDGLSAVHRRMKAAVK
jgi:nucleoside-diphosphate-sugar epimerase